MQLTPEEILALVKAIPTKEAKAARKAIANGSQSEVDVLVRISGTIKRANKPKPAKGTSAIPWKAAIALFLKRSGATGPASARLLADVITESAKLGAEAKQALLLESGVGDALQIVDRELFSKLPPIAKDGNITFSGEAIVVSVEGDSLIDINASGIEAAK